MTEWTKEPPVVPGWYWCRIKHEGVWFGPMICDLRTRHRPSRKPLRKMINREWWPGPIQEPPMTKGEKL